QKAVAGLASGSSFDEYFATVLNFHEIGDNPSRALVARGERLKLAEKPRRAKRTLTKAVERSRRDEQDKWAFVALSELADLEMDRDRPTSSYQYTVEALKYASGARSLAISEAGRGQTELQLDQLYRQAVTLLLLYWRVTADPQFVRPKESSWPESPELAIYQAVESAK